MRDESDLLSFSMSAKDGSMFARGEMKACTNCLNLGGDVKLQGSVVLGGQHSVGGWVNITGEETTMHSIAALGSVQIGAVNASTSISVVGGMVARSHTPGLFSKVSIRSWRLIQCIRTIRFGASFEASDDAALHSRTIIRTGLGNRLDVRGYTSVSGSVHVQGADLAVQGVTKLQRHLNGTALLVEGGLILGLNETIVEVPRNITYYSLTAENVSAEFLDMDLAQAQQVVSSQNLTFAEHNITLRTITTVSKRDACISVPGGWSDRRFKQQGEYDDCPNCRLLGRCDFVNPARPRIRVSSPRLFS